MNWCVSVNEPVNHQSKPYRNDNIIDVEVKDILLTPLSCAHIVNEILKCLIYQKAQIPYPYNWLKTVINRKRSKESDDTNKTQNFTASNHYRQASVAYDTLDELMKEVITEFTSKSVLIEQVVIVFGIAAQCPQQIYNINIPELARNHLDNHHITDSLRNQHKVLRKIFLSEAWMESMDMKLNTVNTYVFLKKKMLHSVEANTFFVPCNSQQFTRIPNQLTVNMKYDKENQTNVKCCNFEVFSEISVRDRTEIKDCKKSINSENESFWYAPKSPVKGFKDCFINKISASEFW